MKISNFPDIPVIPGIPLLTNKNPEESLFPLLGIKNIDDLKLEVKENEDIWLVLYKHLIDNWEDISKKAMEDFEKNKETQEYEFYLQSEVHRMLLGYYFNDIPEPVDIELGLEEAKNNAETVLSTIEEKREEIISHKALVKREDLPVEYHSHFDNLSYFMCFAKYSEVDKALGLLKKDDNIDIFRMVVALYDNKITLLKYQENKIPDKDKFNVIHEDGIDNRMKIIIKEKAELSHFYGFYEFLSKNQGELPTFDYHYEYIERYAYNFLDIETASLYAAWVHASFLRECGGFEHECKYPMSYEAYHRIENNLIKLTNDLSKELEIWMKMGTKIPSQTSEESEQIQK